MKNQKPFYSKKYFFPIFILIATLFMSVGYASINSVILSISGTASAAETKDGVYISDAYIDYGVGNGVEENSKITQLYQTNFGSTVVLDSSSRWSYLYFVITIYNSTDNDHRYVGPEYVEGESTYDNPGIVLTVSDITTDYILKSKESVTFSVLFSYKNYVVADSNVLNSIINFKFESLAQDDEEEELPVVGTVINVGNSTSGVFGSSLSKYSVESISFINDDTIPTGAVNWDASVEQNGSIKGWYVDSDNDAMYEVYIGAKNGKIGFPENSEYMFSGYTLEKLDFSNVDTTNVTSMRYMFQSLGGITELDLSNFRTPNLTNMNYMLSYCYYLKTVDMSNFDTSNVTSLSYIFVSDWALETVKLNNATFSHNPTAWSLFSSVPTSVQIIVKDEEAKTWVQSKAGSSYTNIVTVAELS